MTNMNTIKPNGDLKHVKNTPNKNRINPKNRSKPTIHSHLTLRQTRNKQNPTETPKHVKNTPKKNRITPKNERKPQKPLIHPKSPRKPS